VTFQTCDLSPFVAKVVAQKGSLEDAASALQIFIRQLEGYLRQLKSAVCVDLANVTPLPPAFIDLTDVPHSYAAQAGKLVRVNATQNGLEFFVPTPGLTRFTQLIDVPNTYVGSSLKGVRVNAAETALEFYLRSLIGLSDFPASYTSQALKFLRVNAGATAVEFVTAVLTLLADFPASYSGAGLKFLRVNAGATAVEFITAALTLLSDFPASYSGAGLKALRVNAGATAVEFFTQALTLLSDFPASYTGKSLNRLRVNAGETAVEFIGDVFTNLQDVPNTYSGNASKIVAVNSAGTGLQFLSTVATDLTFILSPAIRWYFVPQSATVGGGNAGVVVVGDAFTSNSLTIPNLATTNLLTSTRRLLNTGSAVAGNAAVLRNNAADGLVWRGNAAGLGGFRVRIRFGTESALAQQRAFIGLCNQLNTTFGNANPSTFTDLVGFSYDSAATNWSTITNDNAGSATTASLGASFPVDATTLYEIELIAAPNASSIDWKITNLSSGASSNGTFSSDLPRNSVFLNPQLWINNGTTATAAKLSVVFVIVALYG
jgi:Flp pilus assembly pilin Flp